MRLVWRPKRGSPGLHDQRRERRWTVRSAGRRGHRWHDQLHRVDHLARGPEPHLVGQLRAERVQLPERVHRHPLQRGRVGPVLPGEHQQGRRVRPAGEPRLRPAELRRLLLVRAGGRDVCPHRERVLGAVRPGRYPGIPPGAGGLRGHSDIRHGDVAQPAIRGQDRDPDGADDQHLLRPDQLGSEHDYDLGLLYRVLEAPLELRQPRLQ